MRWQIGTMAVGVLALWAQGAVAQSPMPSSPQADSTHCQCIARVGQQYDPYDAYDDANMPTLGVEVELRRWAHVERLYAACMRDEGRAPRDDAFPFGVSDYPDGPEFHPAECRS